MYRYLHVNLRYHDERNDLAKQLNQVSSDYGHIVSIDYEEDADGDSMLHLTVFVPDPPADDLASKTD